MNKSRHPMTFAGATTRAMGILGGPEAGRAIGKSEALVRKAADPDHPWMLNLEQAVALDLACLAVTTAEGRPETPFLTVFAALVARPQQAGETGIAELQHRLLGLIGETGDVARAMDEAARDGAISANDKATVAVEIREVIVKAQAMLDALTPQPMLRAVDGKGGAA